MQAKVQEKEKAIRLRKKGYSYGGILKELPVAKSTLSNWLKDLPLTSEEKKSLRKRTDSNISRGRIKAAAALRALRKTREKELFQESKEEFEEYVKDPFFHVGIALYWAEGAKRSTVFGFSNSDPKMLHLFVQWIESFFGMKRQDISARLYIHKLYAHENCEYFWSEQTGIPSSRFSKTVYKPTGLLVKKRPNYKGCLRISVSPGTRYLKKMLFWQNLLIEHYHNQ